MTSKGLPRSNFSFSQARSLIGDLNQPNPWIYWTDFLVSVLIGHVAIQLILAIPQRFPDAWWAWLASGLCYVITIVMYMRALMFIHELVHLPKHGYTGFRVVWNLLCGIPFLVPSFLYYPHVDHHRRKHYGTEHDGEYLALSHQSRWLIVGFVAQALVIPFLGIARFLLISPVCWLIPGARQWVHRHASTMLVDPSYERTDASPKLMRTVVLQEACCFVWCVVLLSGHWFLTGQWFNPFWIVAYGVAQGLLVMNEVRTLGAHRWTNEEGEMTFEEQLLDTVNYPYSPWVSELWGPVGTRYHALHHLFPRLPYHNLGKAHARLVEGLPPDSIYHQTIATSLTSEIIALWKRASEQPGNRPSARESKSQPALASTANRSPQAR
ncbi:Fatty acid desaturase [Rubripirellula lacrimiformis]|uniref:Fatty acid desaturase n=1 Tax=Rubripirellula lacrimiformis TaxID=1930273 RepID=A0A517N413_9BACT|nr:fatty acid desaturase [Rubripirellula lacrimiformis]QDT01875.1 Fatty acid desaturase [Rubripirellula lacrimiformis]